MARIMGKRLTKRSEKSYNQAIGCPTGNRTLHLPEIIRLEDQVSIIKAKMLKEPLRDTSGHYFASCRRVFNNGSLKAGGRLYGH